MVDCISSFQAIVAEPVWSDFESRTDSTVVTTIYLSGDYLQISIIAERDAIHVYNR